MNILCVIPSRIKSTRLPRKPLLKIKGTSMVQMVYENAKASELFADVVVATDSIEIASLIQCIGGNVMMTAEDIPCGTDRVAKVARKYGNMDVVVNLQGDEPFVKGHMLEELVKPFKDKRVNMTTLAFPLDMASEYKSPDVVKVIMDKNNDAIYFSRSPIPYCRTSVDPHVLHHMGVYAFTADFLRVYSCLDPTPLEQAESLEQLRVLENGCKIRVCPIKERTLEINTREEYERAQTFGDEWCSNMPSKGGEGNCS